MMQHAWDGYAKYGWGKNEVRPVSLRGHTASIFGSASMGATIVDALDTLYIMGMMEEYEKAREHVRFCIKIYRMQMEAGRMFMHEHPTGASSWKLPEMDSLK